LRYFKLSEALKNVQNATGRGETALAGAKLLGKTLFNAGKFVAEGVVKANEKASAEQLKRDDLTPEQREKFEQVHRNAMRLRIQTELTDLDVRIAELTDQLDQQPESASVARELRMDIESLENQKRRLERQREG